MKQLLLEILPAVGVFLALVNVSISYFLLRRKLAARHSLAVQLAQDQTFLHMAKNLTTSLPKEESYSAEFEQLQTIIAAHLASFDSPVRAQIEAPLVQGSPTTRLRYIKRIAKEADSISTGGYGHAA